MESHTGWGIGMVAATAAGAWAVGGGVDSGAVALVGGIAAVMAAARPARPSPTTEDTGAIAAMPLVADVLDTLAEPVLLVADGRVALANRAAEALLGRHIVGEDVRVAIRHPAAADLVAGGRPGEMAEVTGLGGIDQHWEVRIGVTADARRIVHLVDRTGSRASEQMRVDFVANASHELRTPLSSILGFVETLKDEAGEDPPTRQRFLSIIDDEAKRMQRLVGDLISLSRIEADKYRLPSTPLDLAALARDVVEELRQAEGARGADLVLRLDNGVPAIAGDRAQLSQLLHNLVGNAMKYGRPGTPVTIRLSRDGDAAACLTITDQGEGIASQHIPRLTERFYRVDAGRSRSMGGTGLGLAIVKHIVERHRGRFRIESRVGHGTSVLVTLPLALS